MNDQEQKIKEKLMKDSDRVFQNQLDRAEGLLSFDEEGRGRPEVQQSKITNRESVYLSIAGSWFAYKAGVRDEPTVSRSEISQSIGMSKKAVGARVSELKKNNLVESVNQGEYKITYAKLDQGLAAIESKVSESE